MRFILGLVLSLSLCFPSFALSAPPEPTAQEIYDAPITSEEASIVKFLAEHSKLSPGEVEQVIRVARSFETDEPFILLAVMMVESGGDVKARNADRHGLMGVSEYYLTYPFVSECGVSSVDDLYDIRKSFCVAHPFITSPAIQGVYSEWGNVAKYGGGSKKGYMDKVRAYHDKFVDLIGKKK
jgi:hypothetical protein